LKKARRKNMKRNGKRNSDESSGRKPLAECIGRLDLLSALRNPGEV
jgi:hypothetical protein